MLLLNSTLGLMWQDTECMVVTLLSLSNSVTFAGISNGGINIYYTTPPEIYRQAYVYSQVNMEAYT